MNKSLLLLAFLFYSVLLFALQDVSAQSPEYKCGTMENLQKLKESDPTLESKILLREKQIQQWIDEEYTPDSNKVITIPVVVHIIYNTDYQNISDQRVFEQIEMLNRDYAGLNTHSMGAFSDTLKVNTGIQFCLAKRKPDGTPTNGIERRYTTVTGFVNNSLNYSSQGGMDAWNPKKYMNIWVCNLLNVRGSAQHPDAGVNETYGAAIHYTVFGATGANPNHNNGRTTAHELGHCLNLYHIWADDDGECYGSDYCKDTPNQANSTGGHPTGIITDACSPSSPGIMYMNFMDYTDDTVSANFTPNQTARMQALFASPNGLLLSLANSDACSPPTSIKTVNSLISIELNIFPNPVKDKVTVNYKISEPGIVKLSITNIFGIELARICNNQYQEQGNYSIKYDASIFTPGVYYLNISFGNITETKKFVLIR